VRFEDVNRTERFLMEAWEADPLIPASAGLIPVLLYPPLPLYNPSYNPSTGLLPIPGIYGVNESNNRAVYKDTREVSWDAKEEVGLCYYVIMLLCYYLLNPLLLCLYAINNFKPTSSML
jgi:hypothetical protein